MHHGTPPRIAGLNFRIAKQLARSELSLLVKWFWNFIRYKSCPCPGGFDFLFLTPVLICLLTLSLILLGVSMGLDQVTASILGRVESTGGRNGGVPIMVQAGDGITTGSGFKQALAGIGISRLALAPIIDAVRPQDWTRLQISPVLDASQCGKGPAEKIAGRFVEAASALWPPEAVKQMERHGPFVMLVDPTRPHPVVPQAIAQRLSGALPPAMVDRWLAENRHATWLSELRTAWFEVSLPPTSDAQDRLNIGGNSWELVPVRVVVGRVPGLDTPDVLLPMEILRLTPDDVLTGSESAWKPPVHAEHIARQGGYRWYGPANGPAPARVEAVRLSLDSQVDGLGTRLAMEIRDACGNSIAELENNRIRIRQPVPPWLIAKAVAKVSGEGLREKDQLVFEESSARQELPENVIVTAGMILLPWESRHEFPMVLQAVEKDKRYYVHHYYRDVAIRLSGISTIIDLSKPTIAIIIIMSLIFCLSGFMCFIVQNRRQRYALLISHGMTFIDLVCILAMQLMAVVIVAHLFAVAIAFSVLAYVQRLLIANVAHWGAEFASLFGSGAMPLIDGGLFVAACLALPVVVLVLAVGIAVMALRRQGFRRELPLAANLFGAV